MATNPENPVDRHRVAIAQMTSGDDVSKNIAVIAELAKEASSQGAKTLFLPECCVLMQSNRKHLLETAEALGEGAIQSDLAAIAAAHQVTIFAGSIPLKSPDPQRIYNASIVFDEFGRRVAYYAKVHLFDITLSSGEKYLESGYTMPGNSLELVNTPIGRIGLSICYDLRFPELYRQLTLQGAEILLVPSAFAVATGEAHWEVLLRARAVENGCYVVAASQWGKHPGGRRTWGHSILIDPWGEIIAEWMWALAFYSLR